MKKSHWRLVMAVPVLLVAYFLFRQHTENAKYVPELFGGKTNVDIVNVPDSIQAWETLGYLKTTQKTGSAEPIDFYTKADSPIPIQHTLAAKTSRLLLDPGNYLRDRTVSKPCAPRPGFVLSFFRKKQSVDVFICLECDILQIQASDGFKACGDCDPSHNKILRLLKEIFPNDARVQGIREI